MAWTVILGCIIQIQCIIQYDCSICYLRLAVLRAFPNVCSTRERSCVQKANSMYVNTIYFRTHRKYSLIWTAASIHLYLHRQKIPSIILLTSCLKILKRLFRYKKVLIVPKRQKEHSIFKQMTDELIQEDILKNTFVRSLTVNNGYTWYGLNNIHSVENAFLSPYRHSWVLC